MSATAYIPLLAVIVAIISIYFSQRNFSKTVQENMKRHSEEVSNRIVALEVKIDVFWRGVAFDQAKILHQPHPKWARRDALLEKLLSQEITNEELVELREMLQDAVGEVHDVGNEGQRVAASILLRIIEANLPDPNSNPLLSGT